MGNLEHGLYEVFSAGKSTVLPASTLLFFEEGEGEMAKKKKKRRGFRKSWPRFQTVEEALHEIMLEVNVSPDRIEECKRSVINDCLDEVKGDIFVIMSRLNTLGLEKGFLESDKSIIMYPQNTEVVRAVWNMKLDLAPEDLYLIPPFVEIRYPQRTMIDGVSVKPTRLYNIGRMACLDYAEEYFHYSKKWQECCNKLREIGNEELGDEEEILAILTHIRNVDDVFPSMTGIPMRFATDFLQGNDSAMQWIENCKEGDSQDLELHHKLAVKMAFYSLTGNATNDLPQQYLPRERQKVVTLNLPKVVEKDGTSPSEHWRHEHERRYPIRIDGTRRNGKILVRGAVINREKKAQTLH